MLTRHVQLNGPGKDIFQLDKLFFPINQDYSHWVVVVVVMERQCLYFHDSLMDSEENMDEQGEMEHGKKGYHYLEQVFQYLKDEHLAKFQKPLPEGWDSVYGNFESTPQQKNGMQGFITLSPTPAILTCQSPCTTGSDCGVFMCMCMAFYLYNAPLEHTQDHMVECRQRICLSILDGKIRS